MKRRIIRSSATVNAAYDVQNLGKFAAKIFDDLEEFLDRCTRVHDLPSILSEDDRNCLAEAYDILMDFSREYQTGGYTEGAKSATVVAGYMPYQKCAQKLGWTADKFKKFVMDAFDMTEGEFKKAKFDCDTEEEVIYYKYWGASGSVTY